MTLKYIRTKDNQVIVFPDTMLHKDFAGFNPISAGFIDFNADERGFVSTYCHGESVSLKLKSFPEDTEIANRYYEDKRI